jgi:hypothetical protein
MGPGEDHSIAAEHALGLQSGYSFQEQNVLFSPTAYNTNHLQSRHNVVVLMLSLQP